MNKAYTPTLLCFFIFCTFAAYSRSPHRPADPTVPSIKVSWHHDTKVNYEFADSHLQEALFELFDAPFFFNTMLPADSIHYRYEPHKSVTGAALSQIIEQLLVEIKQLKKRQHKVTFKDFTILKKRDVNKRNHTGLFVVEFKDYPFILKLFVETPEGVVTPLDKGFEPICFYYLAGLSRHFNGFSRIKNLMNVKKIVQADPYWSTRVDFPRKWFWLPKDQQWITIEGKNIGQHQGTKKITIPAIYGIICDKIVWEKPFCLTNQQNRDEALTLCNFLGQRIDSHINNFGIEIQSEKIVPIDFEHFITAVGIEEDLICNNYFDWYLHLTHKTVKRLFFRNKYERRQDQYKAFNPLT